MTSRASGEGSSVGTGESGLVDAPPSTACACQGRRKHGEAANHPNGDSLALGYNYRVADLGKALIVVGVVIVGMGAVLALAGRTHLPLGRLPGDIVYRGKNTTFYFPLATSILLSVALSLLLYLIGKFRH